MWKVYIVAGKLNSGSFEVENFHVLSFKVNDVRDLNERAHRVSRLCWFQSTNIQEVFFWSLSILSSSSWRSIINYYSLLYDYLHSFHRTRKTTNNKILSIVYRLWKESVPMVRYEMMDRYALYSWNLNINFFFKRKKEKGIENEIAKKM